MSVTRLGMRGVVGRFFARLEALTATAWADAVSILNDTDEAQEEYKWIGQTPAVREWIGGRAAKAFLERGPTIVNKLFEATIGISVDELRRDKSGQINTRIDELADRVAEHWHKLLTELIVTPGNSYDGVAYFGTTHAEGDSGTQKNAFTSSEIAALNVAVANAPTDDEMSNCIKGIVQEMLKVKDDQGEPMNASAREYLIMTPPNLWGPVQSATLNPLIAAGSGARTNLLTNMTGYRFRAEANPRLAADTVFYVFRTDASMKPFIRQNELLETSEDDTEVFKNNRMLFGVKALRNVGTAYWQYAAKATLS